MEVTPIELILASQHYICIMNRPKIDEAQTHILQEI